MSLALIRHPLARAPRRTAAAKRGARPTLRTKARAVLQRRQEVRTGRVRVGPLPRGLGAGGGKAGPFGAAYLMLHRRHQER